MISAYDPSTYNGSKIENDNEDDESIHAYATGGAAFPVRNHGEECFP